MSDGNLERITILLQAKDRDFARAMDRNNKLIARMTRESDRNVQRMNRSVEGNFDRMGASALKMGRNFAAGLAAGAIVASTSFLTRGLRQVVRGMAAVGDEARRSGLALDAFQEWRFVAEQNRIGVDQLVDGFKELNLRADEFIVTGGGPAAEAFARLGYDSASLARDLQDPSELMLELIGRMGDLDRAAQIRVADEVFGGSAGERFVELLAQGEDGLRRTIARAHEVGAVMDSEMIARAAELDRRFTEVATRIANIGKEIVTGWGIIFTGIADALTTTDAEQSAAALRAQYLALATDARDAQFVIQDLAVAVAQAGNPQMAEGLMGLSRAMVLVSDEFANGVIDADALRGFLDQLITAAGRSFEAIGGIDGVSLDNASAVIAGIHEQLAGLGRQAAITAAEVAAATITPARQVGSFWDTDEDRFGFGRLAPTTSIRPRRAPTGDAPGAPAVASGRSSGSGGGTAEGYAAAVADIRARTSALEAEAVALVAVAVGGAEYGDAIEYARTRAALLNQAMAEGREITPELQTEIDALAGAYVTAGQSAAEAASNIQRIRDDAERGADAMTDIFMAMAEGGDAAKQAIIRLLLEMARLRMQSSLMDMFGGGGGGGGFLSMFGAALRKRAGGGAMQAGVPHLVNENTANSEIIIPSRSGGVLNVAQAKDALRAGQGGGQPITYNIDARGAQIGVAEQIEAAIKRARPGIVRQSVQATYAASREVAIR